MPTTTFNGIGDARVDIGISSLAAYQTIDFTAFGVPAGATGVWLECYNPTGTTTNVRFGCRLPGDGTNTYTYVHNLDHTVAFCPLNGSGQGEVYAFGSFAAVWLHGWTGSGVVVRSARKSYGAGNNSWKTLDLAADCPDATAIMFAAFTAYPNNGQCTFRALGSTNPNITSPAMSYQAFYLTKCDANQKVEFYGAAAVTVYLLGYVTETPQNGFVMFTDIDTTPQPAIYPHGTEVSLSNTYWYVAKSGSYGATGRYYWGKGSFPMGVGSNRQLAASSWDVHGFVCGPNWYRFATQECTDPTSVGCTLNAWFDDPYGINNITEYGFDWGYASGVYTGEVTVAGAPSGSSFTLDLEDALPARLIYVRAKVYDPLRGWTYGTEVYSRTGHDTTLDLKENYPASGVAGQTIYGTAWRGHTFIAEQGYIFREAVLRFVMEGSVSDIIAVDLWALDGSKHPIGSPLATSYVDVREVPGVYPNTYDSVYVGFGTGNGVALTGGVEYGLTARLVNGTGDVSNNNMKIGEVTSFVLDSGSLYSPDGGSSWIYTSSDGYIVNYGDSAVKTWDAYNIRPFSVRLAGFLVDGTDIDELGFDYGKISGALDQEATNTGTFYAADYELNITGLDAETVYYYRAKAHSTSAGWIYGAELSFTTLPPIPTVTTDSPTAIGDDTATVNGTIDDIGGESPSVRGFVFGLASQGQPDRNTAPGDSGYGVHTEESGSFGTGAFSADLTNLQQSSTYYYRAYAYNSYGYDYGAELQFFTNTNVNILLPNGPFTTAIRHSTGSTHWSELRAKDTTFDASLGYFGIIKGRGVYERPELDSDLYGDNYTFENPLRRTEDVIKVKWKARIFRSSYPYGNYQRKLNGEDGTLHGAGAGATQYGADVCEIFYNDPATAAAWVLSNIDSVYGGIALGNEASFGRVFCDYLALYVCWANAAVTQLEAAVTSSTEVRLRAVITEDEGEACTVYFEYGPTVGYGSTTSTSTGRKNDILPFDITVTPGTAYHARAVIETPCGETFYGDDFQFPNYGQLEVAFGDDIFETDPTWTNVTSYMMAGWAKRGRQHELGVMEPAQAIFNLLNSTGDWWHNNAAGAFYPNVVPVQLIRYTYVHNGTPYRLFWGVIEAISPGKGPQGEAGLLQLVDITAKDMMAAFAKYSLVGANPALTQDVSALAFTVHVDNTYGLVEGQSIAIGDDNNTEVNQISNIGSANNVTMANPLAHDYHTGDNAYLKKFPAVLSGTRIKDVAYELGWPITMCDIDDGTVVVQELEPGTEGTNCVTHMQDVAKTEGGVVFMRMDDGYLVFQDAEARAKQPLSVPQFTLADDGVSPSFVEPELSEDDTYIFNTALVGAPGLATQIVTDGTARAKQGPRVYKELIQGLFNDVDDCLNRAWLIIARYIYSILRPRRLRIVTAADPDTYIPVAMGYDLSSRMHLTINTVTPAGIDADYHIEGLEYSWLGQCDNFIALLQLWEVNQFRFIYAAHDGYLLKTDDVTDYDAAHDAASSSVPAENDAGNIEVGQWDVYAGAIWLSSRIERGYIEFDTSDLDPSDDVDAGYMLLYLVGANAESGSWALTLVDPDAVGNPLTDSDYGVLEPQQTSLGEVTVVDNGTGWYQITLNAAGITYLENNIGGTVKFALRSSKDIAADDPGGNYQDWANIYGVGSAHEPRLIIKIA